MRIEFNPLMIGKGVFTLEASSPELGSYPYKFYLWANYAIPESPVNFQAHLGLNVTHKIKLFNPTDQMADFTSKLKHPSERTTVPKENLPDFPFAPKQKAVEPVDSDYYKSRSSVSKVNLVSLTTYV